MRKNINIIRLVLATVMLSIIILLPAHAIAGNNTDRKAPENYIILLDLSDRLLAPHQDIQDIECIMTIFEEFEYNVYRKLIVNSKDKFCIRIIPQEGSPLDTDELNNQLSIDLGTISGKNKKEQLLKYKQQLRPVLEQLYQIAGKGKTHSDYQGVDIWRYFNESLSYDLLFGANNHLIIISDGYFDFESNKHVLKHNNRYTSSGFLKELNRNNWKSYAEKNNLGLLPVHKQFPRTTVTVIGIHPKNKSLNEYDKLTYFWEKWLREMNFTSYHIIKKNNAEKLKQTLQSIKI